MASEPAFADAAQAADLNISWGLTVVHNYRTMAYFELSRSNGAIGHEEANSKRFLFRAIADAFERSRESMRRQKNFLETLRKTEPNAFDSSVCPLTAREIDILRWTADGKIAEEIATILNLSARTVNYHLTNIMRQLGAPNKTAAVSKALMHAWLY